MDDEVILKRRRVTQACESCRLLKSKCDGKRPVCRRCHGYGYECRWQGRNTHATASKRLSLRSPEVKEDVATLHRVIRASQDVLSKVRSKLDPDDQRSIDAVLASSDPFALQSPETSPSSTSKCVELLEPFRRSGMSVHRYLGEISDVSFFNSVKALLQNESTTHRNGAPLESYEREAADISNSEDGASIEATISDRNAADKYITIYFSTIHIAYPFIDRRRFLNDCEKYWDVEQRANLSSTSVALLFAVFAIGSYYDVCAMSTEQPAGVHSAYFQRALLAAGCVESDYSVDNVRVLLAQCFYLLLAQWTDRCWLTLGLAIRIAQSIGLHVEREKPENHPSLSQVALEMQRRTWHSLYVLDRLLSVQLGRPSAIRNHDCTVSLPSRLDDAEFDVPRDNIPQSKKDKPQTGDYFIAVIKLSAILRHVERDVYRPCSMEYSDNMLQRTDRLDAELLSWKNQLPRWLRFDLGHTFERSAVLKRQRNMLAIKFHHLRCLMHRPYLCLPWLQRNDNKIKLLLDSNAHRVVYFERMCVSEAQATAHLLHDVTDKKSLVEDFPWWQMISCLICASSVLLVMRAFMPSVTTAHQMQREVLEEDANTCLKVFDALSLNSDSARRARDMLQNLRDIKASDQRPLDMVVSEQTAAHTKLSDSTPAWPPEAQHSPAGTDDSLPFAALRDSPQGFDERLPISYPATWNYQEWPSEIADSMAWSSQFVDAWDPFELTPDRA